VYGYHLPSCHRPLEMRPPSQVCKYLLCLVVNLPPFAPKQYAQESREADNNVTYRESYSLRDT
jgi:hypothetical protein